MSTPSWLFIVLVIWIGATMWFAAFEPAQTELLPSETATSISGIKDPDIVSEKGISKAKGIVESIWTALTFDYVILDEGYMRIIRYIGWIFSIASLYLLADLVIMVLRVAYAFIGRFQ